MPIPNEYYFPLTSTAYYYQGLASKYSPEAFYQIGHGMYGGPRGTYGRYLYGPNVKPIDMKNNRERQSGE